MQNENEWFYFINALDKKTCNKIRKLGKENWKEGQTFGSLERNESLDGIRKSDIVWKNDQEVSMTPHKEYYQSLRDKSNHEFNKSEAFLTVIFINHAVSMFDALFTGVLKKKDIQLNLQNEILKIIKQKWKI